MEQSYLQRFIFENSPIRGERVLINDIWQEILARRDYPVTVKKYLGELVATAALLNATIKIEGKLTVQLESNGFIEMLVVQITHDGGLRATAKYKEVPEGLSFREVVGEGRIVITIDAPTFKTPYQGVVAIDDESIEALISRYFRSSEQLETEIFLRNSDQYLGGLLLQRLPAKELDEDDFNRVLHLSSTITAEELAKLDSQTLVYRLFSEDDVRVFEKEPLHFECSCSKERCFDMLKQLEKSEISDILQEDGMISITCEFCGKQYEFVEKDIEIL